MKSYRVLLSVLSGWLLSGVSLSASVNLGSVQVTGGATTTVTVTIVKAGTLGSIAVLTQGAANQDFTNAGGGSCAVGTAYAANATCTVKVTFTPKYSGFRNGAVRLTDSTTNQNVMATDYLQGTGLGPQIVFSPNGETQLWCLGFFPLSVAVDGKGYVYADSGGKIYQYNGAPGIDGACPAVTALDFPVADGIALDGSGDIYVAGGDVFKETLLPNGNYAQSTVASGFGVVGAQSVAVDGAGNVYAITGSGSEANPETPGVFKETLQPDGSYIQSTIGSGWNRLGGVAVDGNGNVYVADSATYPNFTVYKETPSGGSYTQTTVASSFPYCVDLAVDGAGNLYVVDDDEMYNSPVGAGIHEETPQPDGSYLEAIFGLVNNSSSPEAVAVDGAGNLYIVDSYGNVAYEEDLADPPQIGFPATPEGSTGGFDDAVAVFNFGNEPLEFSSLDFPAQFPVGNSLPAICNGNTTLAASATCLVDITFRPTTPITTSTTPIALSGQVTLTTNTLNRAGTEQQIAVSGTETLPLTASPVFSVGTGLYVTAQIVTLTDATPGAVIYYTTNNTTPTTSSPKYTSPITVSVSEVLTAIAVTPQHVNSYLSTAVYTIDLGALPLTVTVHNAARLYGAANPAFTYTLTGLSSSYPVTVTTSVDATSSSLAGYYLITATVSGPNAAKYAVTYNFALLQVKPAPLYIQAGNVHLTYGQTPTLPLAYTLHGFVNGDTQATATTGAPALTTTATSSTPVGFYPIGVGIGTLSAPNYYFNTTYSGMGSVQIFKAQLYIQAKNVKVVQGHTPVLPLAYNLIGFVNGETQATATTGQPSLTTTVTASSPPGFYPIAVGVGTLSAPNYQIHTTYSGMGTVQVVAP